MTDQEIKDYLKELIINQNDICKAVNKLSRKVKKLSKHSNYDLNNIFGDPFGELDKVFDCCKIQAGDKVVNEIPLTDLNNEVQAAINAKGLVNKLEEFTNGWSMSYYGSYNFNSGFKKIQATKAAIEAIQFILDNDLTRSEMEAIKKQLNDMA
jgi:hypothetical protein